MVAGIYCITNNINGKKYIGQSNNVFNRLKTHKSKLNLNAHHSSHLQYSWNKYGEGAFSFEVLKCCKLKYLDRFEKLFIRILNTVENGYNIENGGKSNKSHSEETIKKISESLIGLMAGENHPLWNKHHSEETRKKMSLAKQGVYDGENHPLWNKHHSEESRKKMSLAKQGVYDGAKNPMYGKSHSIESKIKMSKKHNTTGFFRVSKCKKKDTTQGFNYVYSYYDNGKPKQISSVSLDKLKEKVLTHGLEWREL